VSTSIVLRPYEWSQGLNTPKEGSASIPSGPQCRSLECLAKIVSPDNVKLGEKLRLRGLDCHLHIVRGQPDENDRDRRDSHRFTYHPDQGYDEDRSASGPYTTASSWLGEAEYDEIWSLVACSALLYDASITLEIEDAFERENWVDALWRVENRPALQVVGVSVFIRHPRAANADKIAHLSRSWGKGHDLKKIGREFLEKCLKPEDRHGSKQFNHVLSAVVAGALDHATKIGEDELAFEHRLSDAYEVIVSLQRACNPIFRDTFLGSLETEEQKKAKEPAEYENASRRIWWHREPHRVMIDGTDSDQYIQVEKSSLVYVIGRYLQRPWMQNDLLEWMMVDALVYHEIVEYGEAIKQRAPLGPSLVGLNLWYFTTKGRVLGMAWRGMLWHLGWFAAILTALVCLPYVGYQWAEQRGYGAEGWLALEVYGVLLGGYWLLRIIRRVLIGPKLSDKQQKSLESMTLHEKMHNVYLVLTPPVVSPALVRDRMLQVAEHGVIWDGAAVALADHAARRSPAVWVLDHHLAFKD